MIDIHNRKLNTVYRAMIVEFYRYKRIQATRQTQYNTDEINNKITSKSKSIIC